MIIKFISLKLHNYKAHRDLEVKFGDLTKITGDNAKGKSSILEAVPFIFYGTDVLGSKADPSPTNYEFDYVKAELLVSIDGNQRLLARSIEKGKAVYCINEVPSNATEFDELMKPLFDKDLFLSLFNPSYFFSLHWETQRAMLLRYVTAPASKEVFKQLPATQADKLAELVKKHSIDDLEKIHRENKTRQDKAYIAAQSRTKTLQEQLQHYPDSNIDIDATKAEIAKLDAAIRAIEEATDSAGDNNHKFNSLQNRIKSLTEHRDNMKAQFTTLNNEQIAESCRVCGQALEGEAKASAEADKAKRVADFKDKYDEVVKQRKAAEAELAELEYIDLSEQYEKARELDRQRTPLLDAITEKHRRQQIEQQINQARADEAATLASRNDSVFILDAIKAFSAKEAELQAAKVQSLFTTLSLRLFKENKGDGEIKPDFEIERDGKPYRKLSRSEGVHAGLELREVLSEQSGIVAPCAVDDSESVFRIKKPSGQLVLIKAIIDEPLKIETEGA